MIKTPRFTGLMLMTLAILGMVGAGKISSAQEAEGPVENAPALRDRVFVVNDSTFDEWAFGGNTTSATVRTQLDSLLTRQIGEIDRSCSLTEDQKNKLRLAGRGDIKRFLDRVEEKRSLIKGQEFDRIKLREITQQIQSLQATPSSELFTQGSIYFKSIGKTLTAEQSARRERALQDKKASLYRAMVDDSLARVSDHLALTYEQRNRLVNLLLEETQPPKKLGIGGEAEEVMLFQMASLPEAKVKALFDDVQWRELGRILAWWRERGEEILRRRGHVPDNAAPPRNADPREQAAQ